MVLKYKKSVPYIPDLARSAPLITEEERKRASGKPPQPVPFHCKPWLDGQRIGWNLFYGYLTPVTIVGEGQGKIEIRNLTQLAGETNQPRIIDQFAEGFFGLGTGYTLRTPPGLVTLLIPPVNPLADLQLVTGLVETDWYPRQLFLVFKTPKAGTEIHLRRQIPLARAVILPRQAAWQAQPMTAAEEAELRQEEEGYLADEKETATAWQAASGDTFTHLYKIWSTHHSREHRKDTSPSKVT